MSRNERIKKLANAIREYRGRWHPQRKKWVETPNPARRAGVIRWAGELGLSQEMVLLNADGFQTMDEFDRWIRDIE
jgi:hypothetical protein